MAEKTLESVTEVECSVHYVNRKDNIVVIDFWNNKDVAFEAEVALSELPEHLDYEDARLKCTLRKYTDGSTEFKFDYPAVDLENLKEIIKEE